jgi:hypothetical protein
MVHYFAYGTPKGEFKPCEPRAAVITEVNEDGTVGLAVLNPTGMFFNRNVKQGQEGGQWDWMPFQKDQQARIGYGEQDGTPRPMVATTPSV